jgi:hypothetical protein
MFGERGAHRVSWVLTNGPILDGLCVLHRCDNRICVNPSHLFLGTKKDNFQDMITKGRGSLQIAPERGEQHRRAKLTEFQARSIFALRAEGLLQREIAVLLGVSRGNISGILNGHIWPHIQAGALSL